MSEKDGGLAFPIACAENVHVEFGMTLRDWFAGQALAGIASTSHDYFDSDLAKHCYDVADAMLAERERAK